MLDGCANVREIGPSIPPVVQGDFLDDDGDSVGSEEQVVQAAADKHTDDIFDVDIAIDEPSNPAPAPFQDGFLDDESSEEEEEKKEEPKQQQQQQQQQPEEKEPEEPASQYQAVVDPGSDSDSDADSWGKGGGL